MHLLAGGRSYLQLLVATKVESSCEHRPSFLPYKKVTNEFGDCKVPHRLALEQRYGEEKAKP